MSIQPFKRVRVGGLESCSIPSRNGGHDFGDIGISGSASVQLGDSHIHHHYADTTNTTARDVEDKFNVLHKSLVFPRMDARERNVSKALPDTCNWLFQHKHFKEWQMSQSIREHNGFLWIKGKPGCGKSTIMKTALEWTRKQMRRQRVSQKVIYYFFNARAPSSLEKSTLGLYRSLVYQLLEAYPSLHSSFTEKFALKMLHETIDDWTSDELQDFLSDIPGPNESGDLYSLCILIDALDEGEREEDIREMIDFLVDLSERALAPDSSLELRVCFSSRHYPRISIKKGLSLVVEEQSEHNEDIETYVQQKLISQKKLIGFDNDAKDDLAAEVCRKSGSIFLWVVLVVRILNEVDDHPGLVTDLRSRLDTIPSDLNKLFADILNKSAHGVEPCIALLQWVLYAMRPLHPSELYLAVTCSLSPAYSTRMASQELRMPSEHHLSILILDWSRGMVELTSSKPPVVQFIHETVRDYLIRANGLASLSPALSANLSGVSHETLKTSCDRYISTCDIPPEYDQYQSQCHRRKQDLEKVREHLRVILPFIDYSVTYMFHHAGQAQLDGVSQMNFLQDKMLATGEWCGSERHWWNIFERFKVKKYKSDVTLLYFLAEQGLGSLVEELPKSLDIVNKECGRYGSALQAACAVGDEKTVRHFITEKADVNIMRGEYKHALLAAIYNKHFFLVPFLQAARARLGKDLLSRSLFQMIARGSPKGVAILLELGAHVDSINTRGESTLYAAALRSSQEVIRVLMAAGVDVDAQDHLGKSVLYDVSSRDDVGFARLLLEHGANVNAQGGQQESALLVALRLGHTETARLLIENGADVNAHDRFGNSPLQAASFDIEITRLLIEKGADVNAQSGQHGSALQAASHEGHVDVVQLLIKKGANVNAQGGNYGNATQAAKSFVIDLFPSKKRTDVSAQSGQHGNALQAASYEGHVDVVRLLIDEGADVNAQGGYYGNVLQASSFRGYVDTVRLLVNEGANVNAPGGQYGSALQAASYKGYTDTVCSLIENGAKVNVQGGEYGNALQAASCRGRIDIARILIDEGADVNMQGGHYGNALRAASYQGHIGIVRLLIDKGANVHAQGGNYGNALQAASFGSEVEIARLLIEKGADINAPSGCNRNSLQAALRAFDPPQEVIQLLIENGANPNERVGEDNHDAFEVLSQREAGKLSELWKGEPWPYHVFGEVSQILRSAGAVDTSTV